MDSDELAALRAAAASPAGFAHITSNGKWIPFEYLLLMDDYLLRMYAGEFDRLIVEAPIRHGKSELISHYLPVWWLGRKPEDEIIFASYEATFARTWGRKARDTMKEFGPRVFGLTVAEPAAAEEWFVDGHKGKMITVGAGGAPTGRGADLLIIDDPVKNAEEANSEVYRQKTWDWWQATISSRLEPGGKAVLVMARWHEDDLAGRIRANQDPEHPWQILRMPALAEEEGDPLGRKPGEALCPERYDEKSLARAQRERGSYFFNALYQQRPAPAEGLLFKRKDFRYYEAIGEGELLVYRLKDGPEEARTYPARDCFRFQTADVAASEKTQADWTVVSTWVATPGKDLLLIHSVRQKFETMKVGDFLKGENDAQGRPPMWIETFGAGKVPHKQLSEAGYPVREFKAETGSRADKVQRAMPAVAAYERHKVFHPVSNSEPWVGIVEESLVSFPAGRDKDTVDTVSYAGWLLPTVTISHSIQVPRHTTSVGNPFRRQW